MDTKNDQEERRYVFQNQPLRHNGSRAPSFYAIHGVRVWFAHRSTKRSNDDNKMFTSNLCFNATRMKHTWSDLIPSKRSIQQQQKTVAHTCHWNSCVGGCRKPKRGTS